MPAPVPASPGNAHRADDRWLPWIFALMAGLAAWMLTRSWHASILDRYEFRQLQTALSAYWIKQEGFRLDYLTPLFGPPWSVPMEFPTYQWIVAGLSGLGGLELEQAGRLVSIFFFAATLPAVHGLLRLANLAPSRRLLVLAVVLSTPVYLFYTRAVMIESTALCLSVWFLFSLQRTLTGRRIAWLVATVCFAVLAALTKVTTFVAYALPAALLTLAALRRGLGPGQTPRLRQTVVTALMAGLPVVLALWSVLWWVARSDALKHANPYTGFLASTELHLWNYGPLALRFTGSFWLHLWDNVTQNVLCEGGVVLMLVATTFATPAARRVALVCLAGFLTGPLVFANLYHVHDYYYTANALLLTGGAGLLLASAWDSPRLTVASRWLLLILLLLLQYRAFDRGYHYYYWKAAPPPPGLAAIVQATTPADGVVLISGDDWNPLLPYYAQRRAVMVAGGRDNEPAVLDDVLDRLPPRHIAAMILVGDKVRGDRDLIRERTTRFGFSPRPFASSDTADLYLPAAIIPEAATRLHETNFGDARVLVSPVTPLPMDPVVRQEKSQLEFTGASPSPLHGRSQFGFSLATEEGRPVLYAHAPSELYFQPPASARKFTATVGLVASAYALPPPQASDGVTIEVFEQQTDGLRRSLLRRTLIPATRETDRGPQELTYDNLNSFTGRLVFTVSPGPAGNIAYDQAYWARIEIR